VKKRRIDMRRISFVMVAATAVLSLSAKSLRAQSLDGRQIQMGLMGGLTSPAGDLSSEATHAGNAGALVTIATPMSHLRFRLDGQWQQMTGKRFGGALACIGCVGYYAQRNYRILDATANAVYGRTLSGPVSVYMIGGVGVYNLRGTTVVHQGTLRVDASSGATRLGLNGGIGASWRLGHVATFIETRFHRLLGSTSYRADGLYNEGLYDSFQFVPISVGVVF
jgi:hypothetical protein